MRRFRAAGLAVLAGLAVGGCLPGAGPTAPARPGATVRAAWVPPTIDPSGARDVSAAMNAFLRSVPDGSVVRFRSGARYRMDQRLVISGRRDLEIDGNGATIVARTDGDATRSHVRIENSSNIFVHDLTVRGANPHAGTGDAAYRPAREHQHAFDVRSVDTLTLEHVSAYDVYGDFVYLGQMPNGPWSAHVTVSDSRFARNGRQGIALIAVRDVLIERNTLTGMRRATFDLEPRAADDGVDRVRIRDNDIGPGKLMFVAADGSKPVHHVTVADNRLTGQALQIYVHHSRPGYRDDWTIVRNRSDLALSNPHHSAMRIWRVDGLDIRDNRQPFKAGRDMVLADITNSCRVVVRGNVGPGSVGQTRTHGPCQR
jgi:hypothetical protein